MTLFTLLRDGIPEIEIHGHIVVFDGEKTLYQSSEFIPEVPARSLLKPFQYAAGGHAIGDCEQEAACLGSTAGTKAQIETLSKWYGDSKHKTLAAKVKVPASFPTDDTYRAVLKVEGKEPAQIYHNCFSKHMGILRACASHGWDLDTYTSTEHPYHTELLKTLKSIIGETWTLPRFVTDGCTLPSPVMSLPLLAKLYQVLASSKASPLREIRELMLRYPQWIGGPRRIETELMEKNPEVLIAKVGADGLLALGLLPNAKYPNGLGICVKLWAGSLWPMALLAAAPLLDSLEIRHEAKPPRGQTVSYHYTPFTKRTGKVIDISPIISEKISVWPGDVSFKRKVSLDTLKGNHLTLSSVETTLHLGAHTDAINHIATTETGIELAPIEKYVGLAQVIKVASRPNATITPQDLDLRSIRAPRVLFRTDSFPEPNQFNTDFMALSKELIKNLAGLGVVLVGIDTPSIDPFESKDLFAHHATVEAGMAILEGIVLSQVAEGLYTLSALPLRIQKGDASPTRAVLFGRD